MYAIRSYYAPRAQSALLEAMEERQVAERLWDLIVDRFRKARPAARNNFV